MSIEELNKPRYKVIADYPDSEFEIGQRLILSNTVKDWLITGKMFPGIKLSCAQRYPAIFQPVPWWQGVGINDLPEYVKTDRHVFRHDYKLGTYGEILFNQWLGDETNIENSTDWLPVNDVNFDGLLPAAAAEYNTRHSKP